MIGATRAYGVRQIFVATTFVTGVAATFVTGVAAGWWLARTGQHRPVVSDSEHAPLIQSAEGWWLETAAYPGAPAGTRCYLFGTQSNRYIVETTYGGVVCTNPEPQPKGLAFAAAPARVTE